MKKLVTYLVTLGMMISMVPASVSAADTTPETIAVTEESTEKNADREGAAVAVMNNLNVILSLTEGADSNLDDYTKVTDERFKTIDSVKKFISENCTGDLEDEFLKKCEKSLIEKEDGLYKRNSGRFYSIFLTDNGVEIVDPAMDAFIAVTKKRDQMNNYGGVLFKVEGSKWKAKSIESGFFTVNNSESDLESAAYIMASCLDSIFNMLSYSAPEDSTDKITIDGVTYGKAKEEFQGTALNYLKETIMEICTGKLKDSLLSKADSHFVEKDGVLYAVMSAESSLDLNYEGGFTVFDISKNGFTAVTKNSSDKDGYGRLSFVADDGKWRISSYTTSNFNEERLFGGYVDTQSGGLNLREKPNTSSAILTEIPKETQLSIYSSDTDGWYKTEFDGYIGYVSADYIKRIPDSDIPVPVTSTTVTTTSSTTTTTTTTTVPDEKKSQPGDVNNDGEINLKDVVLLRRYIAGGWGVELDENIADVNADNAVDLKDVVLLRRYIAGGWGVTLKSSVKK